MSTVRVLNVLARTAPAIVANPVVMMECSSDSVMSLIRGLISRGASVCSSHRFIVYICKL